MRRLPANNFLRVIAVQVIIAAMLCITPIEYLQFQNNWFLFLIISLSTLFAFSFGLRGAFLLLAPALTWGGIFIIFSGYTISPWVFFIAFFLLASIHLPAVWTHVPYYPTPRETDQAILSLIPTNSSSAKTITFIDVGCGTGRLLALLAKERPDVEFYGVELSILPYAAAKLRSLFLKNLKIHLRSFWNVDFSQFTVIYAFLSPAPMEKLGEIVEKNLNAESIFISNSFQIPERNTLKEQLVTVSDIKGGTLYIYRK